MKSPTLLLVLSLVALAGGCAALTPAPPPEQNAEVRLERGLAALEVGRYTQAFDDLAWVYTHCPGRTAGSHALVALAALELDPRNRVARPAVATELLGRVIRDPGTPDWLRPMAEAGFLTALALGAPHPDGLPAPDPAPDPVADSAITGDPLERADSVDRAEPPAHADSLEQADPAAELPAAVTKEEAPAERPVPDPSPANPATAAVEPAYGCGPRIAVDEQGRMASALPTLPGPSMATLLARSEAVRDSAIGRTEALQRELAAVREQLQATEAELERIRKTLKP